MKADRLRHVPFSNQLTDAETERLAILAEECGEVVQMVGKILRHGYESYHPKDEARTTNRELLENEIGNIGVALDMMVTAEDIDEARLQDNFNRKKTTIKKYLHHQEGL